MTPESGTSGDTVNLSPEQARVAFEAMLRDYERIDQQIEHLAAKRARIGVILSEVGQYAGHGSVRSAPGSGSRAKGRRRSASGPTPAEAVGSSNGGAADAEGASSQVDTAMYRLTAAYSLSPSLEGALRSMLTLDLERGKHEVLANDVAVLQGADPRSGSASAHTYLERLRTHFGLVERLPGRPARFCLTEKAREAASPP
jgi:hypothetical protein